MSIFKVKWGTTWYQRWLERRASLIKKAFHRVGVKVPEEIGQMFDELRQQCDQKGFAKLVREGERAALWIVWVRCIGGAGAFQFLSEIERQAKGRFRSEQAALNWYLMYRIVRHALGWYDTARGCLNRVFGTTWYERSITLPMAAGIVFTVYVLFASAAIAEAQAFWNPVIGYMRPAVEIEQLETKLHDQRERFRSRDIEEVSREDLIVNLRDAGRYYQLASEYGTDAQVELAVLSMQLATLYIEKKESIERDQQHPQLRPIPNLPDEILVRR